MLTQNRKVFGLVGPIASGKGTVAQILKELGFVYYSLSDRIREELDRRGLPITREYLQDMGDELRNIFGAEILAVRTLKRINMSGEKRIVIDSIRNPAEISYLKENLAAAIIAVVASPETRFRLLQVRGRAGDPKTFDEFLALDRRELERGEAMHKIDINGCLELADYTLKNEGTPDDLMEGLQHIFKEFRLEQKRGVERR